MLTPEQREERKKGIGGSDVAAILGLSPYQSAVDIWLDKTGRSDDWAGNEAMYWGNVLEDLVAAEFEKRNRTPVIRVDRALVHPKHPWARGNIDRYIEDGSILECKTAGLRMRDHWFEGGESVPLTYQVQCMWYLAITNADLCHVAALIGGQEYVERQIERDDKAIDLMINAAGEFWHKHVLTDIPPEPRGKDDCDKIFKRDNGMAIEADLFLRESLQKLRAAREKAHKASNNLRKAEDDVKWRMGNSAAIMLDGVPAVTWKTADSGKVVAWDKAFKELATHVDAAEAKRIIAANTHIKAGSRRFLVK